MIDIFCTCPTSRRIAESGVGLTHVCAKCSATTRAISAELLEDGGGGGDFDAAFTIIAGPDCVGERVQLGGMTDIDIGKAEQMHLRLASARVSRAHAQLIRLDYGPSRWRIVDRRSTNGLFVNGQRVADHELKNGDVITIGDYQLKFGYVATIVAAAASSAAANGAHTSGTSDGSGPVCPCCDKALSRKAKICVDCGINVTTGRPILTAQGVDENALYATSESFIRLISLFLPLTPFPMPFRSEAFGTRKPYAIWTIAAATILASVTFFVAQWNAPNGMFGGPGSDLVLWAPQQESSAVSQPFGDVAHRIAQKITLEERRELQDEYAKPQEHLSDDELVNRMMMAETGGLELKGGEFHWYQLLTHALLHDPTSVRGFLMHLGGNLVFLLCFGTRVNALLGNVVTAILYPLLAIAAAGAQLMSLSAGSNIPMLGASGAIMGLAGMYLVLFPAHRVYCAMWISIGWWFRRFYRCKIFSLRGFWVLLIYFGFDLAMSALNSYLGAEGGGVAHWAHIGGFVTGMVIGFTLLLSRMFNTHGGDILSVTLGRAAWSIIGKPNRWHAREAEPLGAAPAY